jgi:hypothetical protein
VAKKSKIHEEVLGALPEKAREAKLKHDTKMASYAKDYQKEMYEKNGNKGTVCGIPLILDIKALWETGVYNTHEIAEMTGRGHQTVRSVVAALNKTQFRSPVTRALAVKATKQILKECPDDNIRLKMISKIFPEEQVSQTGSGVNVNLNIKGTELALKNPNFEYEDLDSY